MVPMIAKKSFVYAGKRLAVGAPFSARSAQDAKLLRAIGNAENEQPAEVVAPVPFKAASVVGTYARKVVEPVVIEPVVETVIPPAVEPAAEQQAPPPAEVVAEQPERQKRAYRRRDLTAE